MSQCVVLAQREQIMHYRVPLYNHLYRKLARRGVTLRVVASAIEATNPHDIEFELVLRPEGGYRFLKALLSCKPRAVIAFMSLNAPVVWAIMAIGRLTGVPVINWRHAVDLGHPKSLAKNSLYRLLSRLANRTLLYAEAEKRFLPRSLEWKIHVANNTVYVPSVGADAPDKLELKRRFGLPFEKVVLFSGRIQPRKRLDHLISAFESDSFRRYALVIIGPGLSERQQRRIAALANVHWVGPVYDETKRAHIFGMADVFCIPGHVGLGICEAFAWGLPMVTEQGSYHAPEIHYLHHGYNGYMTKNQRDLSQTLQRLLSDERLLGELSTHATHTYRKEASPELMIAGFLSSLDSLRNVLPTARQSTAQQAVKDSEFAATANYGGREALAEDTALGEAFPVSRRGHGASHES
jgi:glycosyltransferase involved in cell wall biosynthesis